jgi:hypothetical protein
MVMARVLAICIEGIGNQQGHLGAVTLQALKLLTSGMVLAERIGEMLLAFWRCREIRHILWNAQDLSTEL